MSLEEHDLKRFQAMWRDVGSSPGDFRDRSLTVARALAEHLHRLHFRRGGEPYARHLERVAQIVSHETKETQALAWLHDSMEMTMISEDDLRSIGFCPDFVEDLKDITKVDREPYRDYINRVARANSRVVAVKIADIIDNLTDSPNEERKEKYKAAMIQLLFAKRKYS